MKIRTHLKINNDLCGQVVHMEENKAIVECVLSEFMAADEKGLIHGGFIFGIADYAAMVSVNHENVVLASSSCKFIKPSKVGEKITAKAKIIERDGKRLTIKVDVTSKETTIFTGTFTAVVPKKHVLEPR